MPSQDESQSNDVAEILRQYMTLRRGQTMIEMMIAIAVIIVGVFSALNLVYSNLALVNRDTDEVIAINLSREGVEVAKEIRDSNWLAGVPFNKGMSDGTTPSNYTGTIVWTGAAGTVPHFDFTANLISAPTAKVFLLKGFYQQDVSGGSTTMFSRLLTFHPICKTSGGLVVKNTPALCGSDPEIGVRVESAIQWVRGGITKHTVIYDDLYDWR